MEMAEVIDWSREAVRMALLLGGPALIAALVVGLIVGIGQTLTQLHDQVVAQVPRLIAVTLVVLALLPWLFGRWAAYFSDVIGSIPDRI